MALDHPNAVTRVAVLDIAPTATMYARTDKEFATRYFWWFFLIQPYDLPERLIAGDPEYFLGKHIDGQSRTPGAIEEAIFAGIPINVTQGAATGTTTLSPATGPATPVNMRGVDTGKSPGTSKKPVVRAAPSRH